MFKIGLSSKQKPITEELFRAYARAGIGAMEIACHAVDYDALPWEEIKENAAKNGVELWSLHLPFSRPLDISKPEIAGATVAYHKEIMKKAKDIGIRTFVLHSSSEPITDEERPARIARAKESLRILGAEADALGVTLCVEVLPRTCLGRSIEELGELISVHPSLCVCFDTNHLTPAEPVRFIRTFGKKIGTIHASDYDFQNEKHWVPGEGKIDWYELTRTLKEVGYAGPFMYEVSLEPMDNIDRRVLTCEDFVQNAKEIFEHRPITVLGVPKE